MPTLYVKTGCPFCIMVQSKIEDMGLEVNELNIADDTNGEDLIELGGKRQVPFLVDEKNDVKMYESSDIIDYLEKTYGNTEQTTE